MSELSKAVFLSYGTLYFPAALTGIVGFAYGVYRLRRDGSA